MKRSGPPARRTKLERRTALQRSAPPVRSALPSAARRKPTASELFRQAGAQRRAVREEVLRRDGACLLLGGLAHPCHGPPEAHHLVKAHKRPVYELRGLVRLCRFHNMWVEDWPAAAHLLGLVVREGECLVQAWGRLHLHGLVPHWWDGSPAHLPDPDTQAEDHDDARDD